MFSPPGRRGPDPGRRAQRPRRGASSRRIRAFRIDPAFRIKIMKLAWNASSTSYGYLQDVAANTKDHGAVTLDEAPERILREFTAPAHGQFEQLSIRSGSVRTP